MIVHVSGQRVSSCDERRAEGVPNESVVVAESDLTRSEWFIR